MQETMGQGSDIGSDSKYSGMLQKTAWADDSEMCGSLRLAAQARIHMRGSEGHRLMLVNNVKTRTATQHFLLIFALRINQY